MLIGGLQKSSLLDYPGKISAIIFTQGCNFRCGYCHNPELITPGAAAITPQQCLEFLQTRQGKLDGVVITGGEPCLQADLGEFIREVKSLGLLVKLDTNGSFPEVLEGLPADYIAMDIKAPLDKYASVSGACAAPDTIRRSIDFIMNSGVDYEFRTTVVAEQLTPEDILNIGVEINGAKRYYLQKFVGAKILDPLFTHAGTYSDAEFEEIIQKLRRNIEIVALR